MTSPIPSDLIPKVTAFVKTYMNRFDGSHDFNHIKRVVGTSHHILSKLRDKNSPFFSPAAKDINDDMVTLGALLHDVGDRKYLKEGENAATMVRDVLLSCGADKGLAEKIQELCGGVSWTGEMKDPEKAKILLATYPELAVVQDADRLDAIGAVGIGRVFTFGSVKTTRGMQASVDMFDIKLLSIESRMKTDPGSEMARVYTARLREFRGWWDDELSMQGSGNQVLGSMGVDELTLTMVEDGVELF